MSGAVIRIDQIRPGPVTSSGTDGISRNDLWMGSVVQGVSTLGGNLTFAWTLLDKPVGSASVLTNDATATCSFTPDLAGTYRLKLVTDGGGTGNEQTLLCGVTKDAAGVITMRGWRIPAYKEKGSEANFTGNLRGWMSALETIFLDIVLNLVKASELEGVSGVARVTAAEVQNEGTAARGNSREDYLQTLDGVVHYLPSIDVSATPNAAITLDVLVVGVASGAASLHWYKKSRAWLNLAGVLTAGTQRNIDDELIGAAPPGTWAVTLDDDGTQALRVGVNSDSDDVTWYVVSQRVTVVPV